MVGRGGSGIIAIHEMVTVVLLQKTISNNIQ